MATRKANLGGIHTSGIYADMTVDGPEIGTLVVVVDRAKNLPNRRTMGKQDPYCAARLGKEAKKTSTDRRGGQTPRWWESFHANLNGTVADVKFRDQELRFTVHDSPDYHNLKVSIFNDDKKTELIGETWVSLTDVIVPGGGQSDTWHNLNYRGKYAGEVRMELTYYDSRPRPEKPASEKQDSASHTPVKRRPLPSNPGSARSVPPGFGSEPRPLPSASGPRDYGTPSRREMQAQSRSAGSTPSRQGRTAYNNNAAEATDYRRPLPQPVGYQEPESQEQYQQHDDRDASDQYISERDPFYNEPPRSEYGYPLSTNSDLPLGLPELPPMNSSGRSRFVRSNQEPISPQKSYESSYKSYDLPELHCSYSAPTVPAPEPQPYDDRPMPPLDHTQSDGVLEHRRPAHRPYQPYVESSRDPEPYDDRRNSYTPGLYTGHQDEQYRREDEDSQADDPFDLSSLSRGQFEVRHQSLPPELPAIEAPPPPPAHRSQSSTPSYTPYRKPLPSQDIAPAPLNIPTARISRGSPMQQSSPIDYRSDPNSSPYNESSLGAPRDDAYYNQSPSYHPENFRPPSGQYNASPSAPPRYGYGAPHGSSPDAPHHVHRKSMSQPRDTCSPPAYNGAGSPASTTSLRDHRMSAPYPQQSSPLLPDRGSPYNQDRPSPLSINTPPHKHTPPRPHTMYSSPPSGPYQPSPTQSYNTPPRRHPLSQQQNAANISPSYNQHSSPPVTTDSAPLIKPRALSPIPGDPRQPRVSNRSTPTTRKSISPRPPEPSERRTSEVPFGPDSYDQFNPSARSTSSLVNNPATSGPHTPLGSGQSSSHQSPYAETDGPIVDFHGNKIDPSDRLPESSWAPEPEKKIPVKVKPLRERERLNGARPRAFPESSTIGAGIAISRPSSGYLNLSPGQALNTRPYDSASPSPLPPRAPPSVETSPPDPATMGRNKLRKINASNRPHSMAALPSTSSSAPFQNIPNPRPAFSGPPSGFSSAGASPYSTGAPTRSSVYGNYGASKSSYNLGAAQKPPPIPAKVPLDDMAVLSEEMKRIDIGPSSAPGSGAREKGRRRMLGFGR